MCGTCGCGNNEKGPKILMPGEHEHSHDHHHDHDHDHTHSHDHVHGHMTDHDTDTTTMIMGTDIHTVMSLMFTNMSTISIPCLPLKKISFSTTIKWQPGTAGILMQKISLCSIW